MMSAIPVLVLPGLDGPHGPDVAEAAAEGGERGCVSVVWRGPEIV